MRLFIVTLALAVGLSGAAVATDGNVLFRSCEQGSDRSSIASGFQNGICSGYIYAVRDTIIVNGLSSKTFCIPDAVENSQLNDVVLSWLKGNPQHRHGEAPLLVATAFTEAWPCPK